MVSDIHANVRELQYVIHDYSKEPFFESHFIYKEMKGEKKAFIFV